MLAARRDEVGHLGEHLVDGEWLGHRLGPLSEGEQAADLLLDDRKLFDRHSETSIGGRSLAAAAVEIDGEPCAGDGVAELVSKSGGELAEEPLALAGQEAGPELAELPAHPLDAARQPADLVVDR